MSASRHLEILTRAAVTDLMPLATLKSRLLISGSTEDVQLADWLTEVSDDFGPLTRRGTIALQRYRATLRLVECRSRLLVLPRAPIEAGSVTIAIEGTTITDFEIQDHEAGILWREDGWSADEDTVVTWRAGWLVPGAIAAWSGATAFPTTESVAFVRPTDPTDTPLLMEATTAGTTGGTEPTWPTTVSGTVADGTVEWTARAVEEVPRGLVGLAAVAVQELRESGPRYVTGERPGADSITYSWDGGDKYSAALLRAIERYRL